MSAIQLTDSQAIKQLDSYANEIVTLQVKMNEVLDKYNKLLFKHFGLSEDGKPMSKIDVIRLIQKVSRSGLIQ